MANLHEIIQWCDQTLKAAEFKDYAPNGLQIEGSTEVKRIVCAVTASEDAIDAAIAQNADLLLVHHGYFWKGEPYPITGMRGNRIKKLIQNNISLVAYHLPLDAHPTLGNNVAIAEKLGLHHLEPLDLAEKHPIGNIGYLEQAISVEEFKAKLQDNFDFKVIHLPAEKQSIQKKKDKTSHKKKSSFPLTCPRHMLAAFDIGLGDEVNRIRPTVRHGKG